MESIQIASKIENLVIIEKLVNELSEHHKFDSDVYANLLVGVTEAVNNSIVHGNKEDENKFVTISYESTDKFVVFNISDEGKGFNYYAIPDPTLPENIEKEQGRGIFLMSNLADEVVYNDSGNEVSLKFFY